MGRWGDISFSLKNISSLIHFFCFERGMKIKFRLTVKYACLDQVVHMCSTWSQAFAVGFKDSAI